MRWVELEPPSELPDCPFYIPWFNTKAKKKRKKNGIS